MVGENCQIEVFVDPRESSKSGSGSFKPSPAALIRAAFKLFDSPRLNTIPKRKATLMCGAEGIE